MHSHTLTYPIMDELCSAVRKWAIGTYSSWLRQGRDGNARDNSRKLNLQKQYWEKPKQLEPNLESCDWFYIFPIWLKKRLLMNLFFIIISEQEKHAILQRDRSKDWRYKYQIYTAPSELYLRFLYCVFVGSRCFEWLVCVWEVLQTLSVGSSGTRTRPSTASGRWPLRNFT